MRCAVGFGLFFLSGCFDPGIAPLRCSETQPACPDGFVCVAGTCQTPDSADASAITDLSVDMFQGDMSRSGCASGKGFAIGSLGCWGCAGAFDPVKKASSLCAIGFSIPNNSAKLPDSECSKISNGFFMSAVFGATARFFGDPNFSQCGAWSMGDPGFFGCGTANGSGTVNTSAACSGLRQHIQCVALSGLSCTVMDIDQATNRTSSNGVICCN